MALLLDAADVSKLLGTPHDKRSRAIDPTHALIGYGLDGKPVSTCISKGPHFIVAGTTGSGKSVFINQVLVTMMVHSTPRELLINWVDPKMVEAAPYKGLPFCPNDPVTNMNDAYGLMQHLVLEMEARYDMFQKTGTKEIVGFNRWVEKHPDEAAEAGWSPLPYRVVVIDEFSDMVMQEPDVEQPIVRLGQKSRAAGIHLMIATQRPSADVIRPLIKANIPSRVCLRVNDATNSMIVIDEPGGEKLQGKGDLLFKDSAGNFVRAQGAYLSDEEIADTMDALRTRFDGYTSPFIDYKQQVVDAGVCEWAAEYDESTSWEDKHVVKAKKRPGGMRPAGRR